MAGTTKTKTIPHTQAELRELLDYDPQTGWLIWRQERSRKVKAGDKAGWRVYTNDGIPRGVLLRINGIPYYASRIIWKITYGVDPAGDVTYRNGNPWDLRLANLWNVPGKAHTHTRNRRRFRDNKSGFSGVRPSGRKWQATIGIDGKLHHLGLFDDKREAAAVAAQARLEAGFSLRHATGGREVDLPDWLR